MSSVCLSRVGDGTIFFTNWFLFVGRRVVCLVVISRTFPYVHNYAKQQTPKTISKIQDQRTSIVEKQYRSLIINNMSLFLT